MPTAPPGSSAPGGFTPPTPEELSVLLPQYEITAVLGIGGMGAVYKGRQPKLARDVAIKVLPADATGSEGDEAFNFAERFQREAQAMARLHHQRIISVHDFGEATTEEGKPLLYIVMEFVEGTDLAHLVANESLTSDQMLAVVTQICDALHYAHEQGIVHRDIKPANIMLDVEGNVKVADFGLAKLTGGDAAAQSQLTMTNMAMGTPDYVSPEQLEQGREVDNRADIYSLGVMIYEMLTGAVPRGAFLPPSEKSADDLDPRLDEVVLKAMQADPETRYQQVSQLWTEVEQIRTTPRPVANTLHTGRVPVMGGGTGKVQILTGDTGRVAAKPASTATQLPVKEPMDPAKKKKIITVSLVSTISLLVLGALGYLILAPTPTTDDNLAAAETPTISAETPDKAPAGRPDPHETPTTTNSPGSTTPDQTPPKQTFTPTAVKEPSPTPPTPSKPPESPTAPSAPPADRLEESLDLFTKIDASIQPNWRMENGKLVRPKGPHRSILIPFDAPLEYRLEAVLQPVAGQANGFVFDLPTGDRLIDLHVDDDSGIPGNRKISIGLENLGARNPENPTRLIRPETVVRPKDPSRLVIVVRENSFTLDIDGERYIDWTGSRDDLRSDFDHNVNDRNARGKIAIHLEGACAVHELTLHPPDWEPPATPAAPPSTTATEPPPPPPPPPPLTEAGKKIAALSGEFAKKFQSALGDAHDEGIAALNTSYRGALDRESRKIAASGNLDAVIRFKNEMDALDALASQPITSPLPPDAPARLATMRETYSTTVTQREEKLEADAAPLLLQFDQALNRLQRELTREQKIEDALEVRKARDNLKEKGLSIITGRASLATSAWIPLFNGENLDGWTVAGNANSFRVTDGVIQNPGEPAHLYYTGNANGGTFKDFEFKATIKTEGSVNSGIYIHTRPQPQGIPNKGHEIQIHNSDRDKRKTGSVIGATEISSPPAKDGEWFDLAIRVEENTITVEVDGKTVIEYVEPDSAKKAPGSDGRFLESGTIALQKFGSAGTISFKDIQIRPLNSASPPQAIATPPIQKSGIKNQESEITNPTSLLPAELPRNAVRVTPGGAGGTRTLDAALKAALPGDTLVLAAGKYPDSKRWKTLGGASCYTIEKENLTILGDRAHLDLLIVAADGVQLSGIASSYCTVGIKRNGEKIITPKDVRLENCRVTGRLLGIDNAEFEVHNCFISRVGIGEKGNANFTHCTLVFPAGKPEPNLVGENARAEFRDCLLRGRPDLFVLEGKPASLLVTHCLVSDATNTFSIPSAPNSKEYLPIAKEEWKSRYNIDYLNVGGNAIGFRDYKNGDFRLPPGKEASADAGTGNASDGTQRGAIAHDPTGWPLAP